MRKKIDRAIKYSGGKICVGLDPDPARTPLSEAFFLNQRIINATCDIVAAYKFQLAFYNTFSYEGISALATTLSYLYYKNPFAFVIFDGKFGDVPHVAEQQARVMFETWQDWGPDAVTVNGYMGTDAIKPFLEYGDTGAFVLCKTSNRSAPEVQDVLETDTGQMVHEIVAENAVSLGGNVGLVVGATFPGDLNWLRKKHPGVPFLVPGVGAQGGEAYDIPDALISASRSVIYADDPRAAVFEMRDRVPYTLGQGAKA